MKKNIQTNMKKVFFRFHFNFILLAVFGYLFTIVWLFLFPAVSISSGELKPRGLFVDENALLVNSGLPTKIAYKDSNMKSKTLSNHCDNYQNESTYCEKLHFVVDHASHYDVYQLVVDSKFYSRSLESILVVMTYIETDEKYLRSVHRMTRYLSTALHNAKWLAKRVIVLHVPLKENVISQLSLDASRVVHAWLQSHTTYSEHNDQSRQFPRVNLGLIRDAYILDLTRLRGNNAMMTSSNEVTSSSSSSTDHSLSFRAVQLLHSGFDGLLPNMDLVASALVVLHREASDGSGAGGRRHFAVRSESDATLLSEVCGKLHDVASTATQAVTDGESLVSCVAINVSRLLVLIIDAISPHIPPSYVGRLSGLVSTLYASLTGGPGGGGVHAQLLEKNIDAVTLRLLPQFKRGSGEEVIDQAVKGSGERGRRTKEQSSHSKNRGSGRGGAEEALLHALHRMIYISSSLQGVCY
jgi:hypothetical protein